MVRCAAAVTRNEVTVREAAAGGLGSKIGLGSAKGWSRGAPQQIGHPDCHPAKPILAARALSLYSPDPIQDMDGGVEKTPTHNQSRIKCRVSSQRNASHFLCLTLRNPFLGTKSAVF